jgi:hypothetical protein
VMEIGWVDGYGDGLDLDVIWSHRLLLDICERSHAKLFDDDSLHVNGRKRVRFRKRVGNCR